MTLIFTDPHIEEKALDELEIIFKEIFSQNADKLIMCGDYYDKKRPTAREIIFGTKWAYFFKKKFKNVIFLRGNHDKTEDISNIDYLEYFGIEIVDEYVDSENNYFGHFMVNESACEYGTRKCSIKDLEKYKFVILGHYHSYQKLAPNAIHLGACRYVNFNEVKDEGKYIMFPFGQMHGQRMKLFSPIPMKEVKSVKELPNIHPNTKVCLVINSYQQFKDEINIITKWKDKFAEFKFKLDFTAPVQSNEQLTQKNEHKKLEDVIKEAIEKIEDKDVQALLKEALK
jgi:predicted phosphodiesterase